MQKQALAEREVSENTEDKQGEGPPAPHHPPPLHGHARRERGLSLTLEQRLRCQVAIRDNFVACL
jgi:hypothetical protein